MGVVCEGLAGTEGLEPCAMGFVETGTSELGTETPAELDNVDPDEILRRRSNRPDTPTEEDDISLNLLHTDFR